ncbi:MAG TPA: BatD family protein, partial [Gemmatimonadales bacterium]|nr:BatD family protein [Gemmatimonadales bacterium]
MLWSVAAAAQQPQVQARVDKNTLAAGDTLVYTVTVEARGADAIRIEDPALGGLEVLGARETSSVEVVGGNARRVTTRVLRLVALQPGQWTIGAARVTAGGVTLTTASIGIEVTGDATAAPLSGAALRALIEQAPPPARPGEVAVTLVATPTSVTLGQQLDLLALAWFPREIRSRMRAPAVFDHPRVARVWSYRNVTPAGVVASRRVGSTTYDVFVQHETVFPLHPGALALGPASVSYSFPLTVSFLSREVRHVVQSDSVVVDVRPFPAAGQPVAFRGAAGVALDVDARPGSFDLRVGEGRPFAVTINGRGNVALWPEPEFRWPSGLRVYPGGVEVTARREGLELMGTKTFTYLLMADSAGSYRVAPAQYPYFDWRSGRYVGLRTVALEVMARPGVAGPVPAVAAPAALDATPFVWPLRPTGLPPWALVLLGVLPPAIALAARLPRRRAARAPAALRARDPASLPGLERRFAAALEHLVPGAGDRDARALVAALRAAGMEAPRAAHVSRLRDRLRQAAYGGGARDAVELVAEVREVLAGPLLERTVARAGAAWPALLLALALVPGPAAAQGLGAEQLLAAGANAAAADSFAGRAAREPGNPAHWYHLGVAWFALGSPERARAAWIRAARLAPRNPEVRRALARAGGADPRSRRLMWWSPLTPDEALTLGLVAWVLAWTLVALGRGRGWTRSLAAVGVMAATYAGLVDARYRTPAAVVLEGGTPLREAPYGSAPAVDRLASGTAVRVEVTRDSWVLVSYGDRRGWLIR